MSINEFTDGELISAPRMNEMVGQLNTRYYMVDETVGRTVKVWDYLNNREQLIYGDTGLRKITGSVPDRTSGDLFLRRNGNMVTMTMDVLVLSGSGTYTHAGMIPFGFRPDSTVSGSTINLNATADMHRIAVSTAGNFSIYYYTTGKYLRLTITWATSDPWPTAPAGVSA